MNKQHVHLSMLVVRVTTPCGLAARHRRNGGTALNTQDEHQPTYSPPWEPQISVCRFPYSKKQQNLKNDFTENSITNETKRCKIFFLISLYVLNAFLSNVWLYVCALRDFSRTRWRPAILTEVFRDFPQSLYKNAGIVAYYKLGHDHLLTCPFHFIIH